MQLYEIEAQKRKAKEGSLINWIISKKHLENYIGTDTLPFKKIDKKFCEGFKDYLVNVKKTNGEPLASSSVSSYFSKFRATLNVAVKKRYISFNPAREVETPRRSEERRVGKECRNRWRS